MTPPPRATFIRGSLGGRINAGFIKQMKPE